MAKKEKKQTLHKHHHILDELHIHENRLSPSKTGIILGSFLSICAIFLVILSGLSDGWGRAIVSLMSSLYLGYEVSLKGAVIGALWAFVDGFIAGNVFAILYNLFGGCKN